MKKPYSLAFLSAIVFLFGCVAFQVDTEIQAGRYALLAGRPEVALGHFRRAAGLNDNYVLDFSPFHQGVWTYVGRAYYETGKFSEARQALEIARSKNGYDYLAGVYLGLVLLRDGDRERGVKELQGGMKGVHDWLEDITYNTHYGQFWDPMRQIRSEIERNLLLISSRDYDLKSLIANGEWLGKKMEDEIDRARRDEANDRMRDGGRRGNRR